MSPNKSLKKRSSNRPSSVSPIQKKKQKSGDSSKSRSFHEEDESQKPNVEKFETSKVKTDKVKTPTLLESIDAESPGEVILITPEISPEKNRKKISPQSISKDVSPQDKKDTKNWTYVESESSDEEGDLTCQKCQVNELLAAKFSQKGSLFEKFKIERKDFHDLFVPCINRYRRRLETCPQAKMSKSGHAIFFCFFRRARATSMTQRKYSRPLLDVFACIG